MIAVAILGMVIIAVGGWYDGFDYGEKWAVCLVYIGLFIFIGSLFIYLLQVKSGYDIVYVVN